VATDERETIPCGIVFRSVGYRGLPLPGVPFDERSGTIPNKGGRVEPGTYVAGWIKRGPSGVIGTNKKDATETVALLLEDAHAGRLPARGDGTLEELLEQRRVEAVMYAGWEAIDRAERSAGEPRGRPRIKLCGWDELLAASRAK
ncbi:MAG: NADP oxidoreductase, partial [Gaiellaceae bacterium]